MPYRTIPSDNGKVWTCEINGVKYSYDAGEYIDVPDVIAAIIDTYEGAVKPQNDPTIRVTDEVHYNDKNVPTSDAVARAIGDYRIKSIAQVSTDEIYIEIEARE